MRQAGFTCYHAAGVRMYLLGLERKRGNAYRSLSTNNGFSKILLCLVLLGTVRRLLGFSLLSCRMRFFDKSKDSKKESKNYSRKSAKTVYEIK